MYLVYSQARATLSVDQILPRAAYPQLDNATANLELMPMKFNATKQDKMGDRQRILLKRFREVELITNANN